MIKHSAAVGGEPVTVSVVENEDDLDEFRGFISRSTRCLGVDSETTGLDIYSDRFRLRLVQFGTPTEAYVLPVELGERYEEEARCALMVPDKIVLHNASYDLQVFDRTLGVPMEKLWPRVIDTRILAHLVDPRGKEEGGIGHSLEELTRHYVDPVVADGVKSLMRELAVTHKTTVANIWKKVDLKDPQYQLYSGMDPILAAKLLQKLAPLIPSTAESLIPYEHSLAEVCSQMEKTGFLLDTAYAENLAAELKYEESLANETALGYGCQMVNSTDSVADTLEMLGVKITKRTPTGKRKVDDDLLMLLATGEDVTVATFADAVIEAKKAGKWRKTWVQKFLDTRDANDRCHASINPLRARTGRMSITGIPAQTLPAGDATIRRCFLADEGQRIVSVDYQAQELRVLAALSGDQTMIRAFRNNADLHQITADAAGVTRSVGKMANFLQVYGGGAGKLAGDAKIPFIQAKHVVDTFRETYPGVGVLSKQLQQQASRDGYITTPVGRRLPVDETRAYSSLNYLIQSTARDVTGRALIRLHEAGFTPYLRLPLHDEVLCSVPEDKAEWGAQQIGRIMAEDMGKVHISTEPKVGGRSWGSLYGSEY